MDLTCSCGAALHVDMGRTTLSVREVALLLAYWERQHSACEPARVSRNNEDLRRTDGENQ